MKHKRLELKNYFSILGEEGRNPTLDIYLPYNMVEMRRENQKRPCMLVCPGGGYGMCSERESEPIALHFLPEGFNVFVLTYSVAPNRFPTQIREVAAAVDLIYKNADEWNCDTEKISIMGFSAGGHLAAHYSNAYNIEEIKELYGATYKPFSSVLCYPVISADPEIAHKGSIANLLGYYPEGEEADKYSCDKLVTADTPPAFIWHTAPDAVYCENSLLYATALSAKKVPFELHIYPYGDHGGSTFDIQSLNTVSDITNYNSRWVKEAGEWLKLMKLL